VYGLLVLCPTLRLQPQQKRMFSMPAIAAFVAVANWLATGQFYGSIFLSLDCK